MFVLHYKVNQVSHGKCLYAINEADFTQNFIMQHSSSNHHNKSQNFDETEKKSTRKTLTTQRRAKTKARKTDIRNYNNKWVTRVIEENKNMKVLHNTLSKEKLK